MKGHIPMLIKDIEGNTIKPKDVTNKPHLYKIFVIPTEEIYIGVHNGNNTRIYAGGGSIIKNKVKHYGKENVVKYILEEFDELEDAYKREAEVVSLDFINQSHVLNVRTGGRIYEGSYQTSDEYKQRLSVLNSGENNPGYGIRGKDHPSWGKKHSSETREIISKKNKERFSDPEERRKYSEMAKKQWENKIHPNKGVPLSEEHKEKMLQSMKKKSIKCEHCGNTYYKHLYNRWHGDKCKKK